MEFGIHFGCLSENLEAQCNHQGFTLGKKKDEFQSYAESIMTLYMSGLLNDKEKENVCHKLFTRIKRSIRVLNPKK